MTHDATSAAGEAMPAEDSKSPKKPEITSATVADLALHYNGQVDAYNAAMDLHVQTLTASAVAALGDYRMKPITEADLASVDAQGVELDFKLDLIELIRKQNHRLGRTIKARSIELLMSRAKAEDGSDVKDRDGRSIGLSYSDILAQLAVEFPESSTSPACLRWYVVHLRADATAEGLPWPDLPQVRPRSGAKRKA